MEALPALWIVAIAFLAAGTVKGVAGVGLPMTVLGILTFFTDPRTAFSLVFVPIVLANAFQLFRAGGIRDAIKRYLPFIISMMIFIPVLLWMSADAPEAVLLISVGIVLIIFVFLNLSPFVPRISDRYDKAAQVGLGTTAGILGGLTSLWLPAIVIFLTARDASKDEFIRATSLLLLLGTLPLAVGYVSEGFLTGPLALLSTLMVIPTTLGQFVGEKLRARLSEQSFRLAILALFFLVGLNLLRRGLFG